MYNIFTTNAMRKTIIAIKICTQNIMEYVLEISEQYDSCDSYESSELSELSEYDKENPKLNTFNLENPKLNTFNHHYIKLLINDDYKSLKKYKPCIKPNFTILPMYNIFMLDTI